MEHFFDALPLSLFRSFFNDPGYKEYLENACSFNRKLNEERKMRIPYIDGQTGVAQRHYDNQRSKRERMPPEARMRAGGQHGQILSYPRKSWKKKRYQYLKFFMQPRRSVYDPESEMHVISQIENPSLSGGAPGQAANGEDPAGAAAMMMMSAGGAGGAGGPGAIKDESKNPVRVSFSLSLPLSLPLSIFSLTPHICSLS